jgi:hypothetical protein
MGNTYSTVYQCSKCSAVVPTSQPDAGFIRGYGTGQLKDGPCPAGGSHDWHELTQGKWTKPDGSPTDCFITTAVCRTLEKPDDCSELTNFRHFRDTFMQQTPEMQAEVEEYYHIAPRICTNIDNLGQEKAARKYASIWENSLKPTFDALNSGNNEKAHILYKDMVLELKQEFSIN